MAVLRGKLNWHYVAIGLVALAAHGLVLLNDGIYWDGWIIYSLRKEEDWASLLSMFLEAGAPATAYVHWLVGSLPGVILGYKLVAFLAILFAAVLVYGISQETGWLGRWESLFIALLTLVYPAFQASVELIILPSLVLYVSFLAGVFLVIQSEKSNTRARYGWRIGALAAFLWSFRLFSLLVFYYGFLLLWLAYVHKLKSMSLRDLIIRFLRTRLDYLLLPIGYWGATRLFFPQSGLYLNMNAISFTLDSLRTNYDYFIQQAIRWQWEFALRRVMESPILGLLTALVALVAFWTWRRQSGALFGSRVNKFALLGFGCVMLLVGMFPYAAVGDWPDVSGWTTRHAVLVGLPMGIIVVALACLVFARRSLILQQAAFTGLTILVWVFTLSTVDYYVDWQARWVKDRSLMLNLSRLAEAKPYSIYWVDDQFPLGGEPSYRFYEYAAMFKRVWGGETRIGIDARVGAEYLKKLQAAVFVHRYGLADFDSKGCQAALTIQQGAPAYGVSELVARYFFYRFLRPSSLEGFLFKVTRVQVQAVASPQAANCRVQ